MWAFVGICLSACREDNEILKPEVEKIPQDTISQDTTSQDTLLRDTTVLGFYLLNEGNMGSNKSTLDYYDYGASTYTRNIYAYANPTVVKELGDVGNDLAIYGSRLYAVINCSNYVEVVHARTARHIGQIKIPNCRYVKFHGGYAYITSYAGPVELNPNYEQRGYVAKVDTATLQIVDRCVVGFQPDELEIVNGKIYVANSGGYMFPNYENTVSVIDLESFTETGRIEVAINLHRLQADSHGQLWVSSRGDYYTVPSRLYCVDTRTDCVADSFNLAVSNFYLDDDNLYLYGVEWSYISMTNEITYGIVDVATRQLLPRSFITDGTETRIKIPYGIMVHPVTKDIYVTDAKNYVTPGTLYCFNKYGKQKWKVTTGDIPAHFAFLRKEQKNH